MNYAAHWEKTVDAIAQWMDRRGFYALLSLGVLTRLAVWAQNRSLFLDEANLARNFCEKNAAALFAPLGHAQYAPPFFSLIQKSLLSAFGQNEYALRAFPLLCGLASVLLFYRLAKRLETNRWVLLALLWVFAFSDMPLRYATEGKQYGCDLLVTLALVNRALWLLEKPLRPLPAALAGIAAPWLSMPAVFVLAGAGLVFWRRSLADRAWAPFRTVLAVGGAWLASFALYYFWVLRPALGEITLLDAHTEWFFPLTPRDAAQWQQWFDLLRSFPYYSAGYTVVALLCGGAGILSGLALVFRRRRGEYLLLAVPLAACLLASGFRQYSLMPRLMLWAFPLVLLLQGLGWQWWWQAGNRYLRPLWVALWLATAALHTGWQYIYTRFEIEEIRSVLDAVRQEFRPNDLLYVSHEAMPAVVYYRDCHTNRSRYGFFQRVFLAPWDARPDAGTIFRASAGTGGRVWLVYSHVVSEYSRNALRTDLETIGRFAEPLKKIERRGAFGYLYAPLSTTLPSEPKK